MTSIDLHDQAALTTTLAELSPLPMAALMIGVYTLLQEGADLPSLTTSPSRRPGSRSACSSPARSPAGGPSLGGRTASAAP
jgi:hypothetical protein